MHLRALRLLPLIALFSLALVGALRPAHANQAVETITIGYIPVVIYAPLYVGIERGYFAEEGLDVKLVPVPAGGADSIIQLAAGNFDAAATGAGAGFWNAAAQGLPFKIVAPLHTERPPLSTPLVISAARIDEIKRIADLKGKTIAINNVGSAIEYWVYSALQKAGLSMSDVTIKAMPFPQMPAALQAGSIDAAVITDPLATQFREQGLIATLADDYIDGITVTYVFFGLPLVEERPQAAQGFVRAYLRALRDLQGAGWLSEETAAIIEKYTQVPAAVVLRMNRPYFAANGEITLADLEALQTYFQARGLLEYRDPLTVSEFVDTSLMESAVEALGEFAAPTAEPTAEATQSN